MRDRLYVIGLLACWTLATVTAAVPQVVVPTEVIADGWTNPPNEARLRAFWWWLNGNVTKEAITHDLEEMKAKGFGGALIVDAGGADQGGNGKVPPGPTFGSAEWRELYRHTLREADRLGLEMSLNIMSGWNVGGPMVKAEDAVKKLTWSQIEVQGPGQVSVALPAPKVIEGFYRDLYVLAWRVRDSLPAGRRPLKNLEVKAMRAKPQFPGGDGWFLTNSSPSTAPLLLDEEPAVPGEEDTRAADVLDLTAHLAPDGTLTWDAPAGRWQVLRLGCTLADICRVSTHSDTWEGYALDVLDRDAFGRYWDAVVEPLIADAGPLAGKTLRYLHTDSWEIGVFNWTPTLREEFRRRRGYDPLPYIPVIAGVLVESREISNRFLHDFRRTLGDLAVDNHYRPFKEWSARHGLSIHPESGGPHFTPIDAQQCLGMDDVPMSEFWARSATHRRIDEVRFFIKQPASAAHTYGRRLVAAEGMTTVGPHWQETLWDNLKPSIDQAFTEGLNLLFWHAFVCSPASMGIPGQQYFAGTHLNPNVTWWEQSSSFFDYINRCQWMLQRGLFVADVLYYYGDHVPNYTQLRASDPARLGPGYDYDVVTEEAMLTRVTVKDGRLVLPDGMTYRVLVLAPYRAISLPLLRKVRDLAAAGATVIGIAPTAATGLAGFPGSDAEVRDLAKSLWGGQTGTGRVIADRNAREVLLADGVQPDFSYSGGDGKTSIEYIHRRDRNTDLYFVASLKEPAVSIQATFRVRDRAAELWDPVTGQRRMASAFTAGPDGRTTVPLELPPYGSLFVVFRQPTSAHPATAAGNAPRFTQLADVSVGPWTVAFDPAWGGPRSISFERLVDWTTHTDPNIRFYSGKATYSKTLDLAPDRIGRSLWLDLGSVREIATVRLNGQSLGVIWAPPFRMDISKAVKAGPNRIEIDVVNFWPNRIIGDQSLPEDKRYTLTNVRQLKKDTRLMPSGLLGPVVILECLGS